MAIKGDKEVKKLLFSAVVGLILFSGCAGRYTKVIKNTIHKSNSVEVNTVVTQMLFTITQKGLEVHRATVPVTIKGAGVMISPNGHILTCAHLFDVGEGSTITVTLLGGRKVVGMLLYQDVEKDLALVKIERSGWLGYEYARLSPEPLELGQEVIAIGNPHGLPFTVTHGIISRINRDLKQQYLFTQTDTPINPGNSGGPLFNLDGELIGIVALKMPQADGLAFAVTPETIREFLDTFNGL